MSSFVRSLLFLLGLLATTKAMGLEFLQQNQNEIDEDEERLIVIPTTGGLSVLPFNLTNLAPFLLLGASSLLSLLGLAALAAILFSLIGKLKYDGYGYGHDEGYGGGGGYSTYESYRSVFDPFAIDWEKFSILDWIEAGEEIWNTFDPSDIECQKRLVCEVHQNTKVMGTAAEKVVNAFSYLKYLEVFSLPEELHALVQEYLDAADRGRTLKKDCGEIFTTCAFSLKRTVDKLTHNQI